MEKNTTINEHPVDKIKWSYSPLNILCFKLSKLWYAYYVCVCVCVTNSGFVFLPLFGLDNPEQY